MILSVDFLVNTDKHKFAVSIKGCRSSVSLSSSSHMMPHESSRTKR